MVETVLDMDYEEGNEVDSVVDDASTIPPGGVLPDYGFTIGSTLLAEEPFEGEIVVDDLACTASRQGRTSGKG